jgi:hypothetical protein
MQLVAFQDILKTRRKNDGHRTNFGVKISGKQCQKIKELQTIQM